MVLFWALASFAANLGLARFSYGALLPALRHAFPASYAVFGGINTLNLGGYLAGTLVAPLFARGTIMQAWTYLCATLVVGCSLLASATSHDVAALAMWRTIMGFASALAIAMTAVLTFERVAPQHRARASSAMWAGAAVGILLTGPSAPLTMGTPPEISWRTAWILMGVATLAAGAGFTLAVRRTRPVERPSTGAVTAAQESRAAFDWRDMLRPHRFLYLGLAYLFFGMAYIAYATFAVALFRAHGVPAAGAGLAWALVGVGGIAGALGTTRLLGPRVVGVALIAAGLAGAAGGILAAGTAIPLIVVSALLFGFGSVATPAVVTALSRARSTTEAYPGTYSAVTAMLCVGQFAGPIIAGPLVDRYGLVAAAVFTTAVYVICAFSAALDSIATSPSLRRRVGAASR